MPRSEPQIKLCNWNLVNMHKKNIQNSKLEVMKFVEAMKYRNGRGNNTPSILPNTLLTAPTQPSHDMPTLRTTVCNQTPSYCEVRYKTKHKIIRENTTKIRTLKLDSQSYTYQRSHQT